MGVKGYDISWREDTKVLLPIEKESVPRALFRWTYANLTLQIYFTVVKKRQF